MDRKNLNVCRQRAADLKRDIAAATKERASIGEAAMRENRVMTAPEKQKFLGFGPKLDALQAQLAENDELLQAAEASAAADRDYRFAGQADADTLASTGALRRGGLAMPGQGDHGSAQVRPRGRKFADLFGAVAASMDGWTSAGEYLHCIGRGLHDGRLRADSQSGGTPSQGGFAVPVQVFGEWLDSSLESEIVRPRCTTWPMATSELDVPALDDLDRDAGTVGGLELRFEAELDTASVQVAVLRQLKLKAKRGAMFLEASNELLSDAPSFESNLSAALIRVLGWGLDRRFLLGTAPGPLGALVAPCTIAVARSSAGDVVYDDILNMFSRLNPASVARAVWLASPTLVPKLATLSVAVGTGGSVVPVMTNNNGEFTIMTRPVVFTEKVPALGTQSDLSLCDFTHYAIGLRKDAALEKSQHVGFLSNKETYRLQIRIDGQPTWDKASSPLNGSSLSPFVTLAA